jgi:type III HopA1-like effector protein
VTGLPRQLAEALRQVRVDITGSTAHLGRHEIRSDSPHELRRPLSRALYRHLHTGQGEWRPDAPRELTDEAFEARLRAVVPHSHTLVAASVGEVSDNGVVVALEGVRVRLPVAGMAGVAAGQDVQLEVDCVRPRLSPGFLLVNGSAGHGLGDGPVLRVYVDVQTPDAAPQVLGATLEALERLAVPYRAKNTSVRAGLPRRDAAVVYLGRRAWHAAAVVADAVRSVPGRGGEVSPYTWRLGPGVSIAWEPADPRPGYRGLSFGEHRSLVISTALLKNAKGLSSSLESAVVKEFTIAEVDPRAPFRDATSPKLSDRLTATPTR